MIVRNLLEPAYIELPITVSTIKNGQLENIGENMKRIEVIQRYGDRFITTLLVDSKGVNITVK